MKFSFITKKVKKKMFHIETVVVSLLPAIVMVRVFHVNKIHRKENRQRISSVRWLSYLILNETNIGVCLKRIGVLSLFSSISLTFRFRTRRSDTQSFHKRATHRKLYLCVVYDSNRKMISRILFPLKICELI